MDVIAGSPFQEWLVGGHSGRENVALATPASASVIPPAPAMVSPGTRSVRCSRVAVRRNVPQVRGTRIASSTSHEGLLSLAIELVHGTVSGTEARQESSRATLIWPGEGEH